MYSVLLSMWNSAQCYSVVCGEDSYYLNLQYSFLKILLQKTRALKQIGHRVHSSQSIRYVLFQSRRELKGQLKGQYLGLVQNRTFALPTFRYKEYCFIYCFY